MKGKLLGLRIGNIYIPAQKDQTITFKVTKQRIPRKLKKKLPALK